MRLIVVTLAATLAACGGGGASPVPHASSATPGATATATATASASATSGATPGTRTTVTTSPPPRLGSASPGRPPTSSPRASAAETRPAVDAPADSKCRDETYRCTTLTEALRWWDGKPALLPRTGAEGLRAMLHAARDPEVRTSTDSEYAPDFGYVMPDLLFHTMTMRKGGVAAAANAGGVVVRTYFATKRWLPTTSPWSRTTTVRGREAIVNEYRPTDGSRPLRDVSWWVPHGDGTYVVWYVADDPDKRSEAQLVQLLDGLVPS